MLYNVLNCSDKIFLNITECGKINFNLHQKLLDKIISYIKF